MIIKEYHPPPPREYLGGIMGIAQENSA